MIYINKKILATLEWSKGAIGQVSLLNVINRGQTRNITTGEY